MENRLEHSKLRLHLCMSFIGGCFGSYMVLRFQHLASAATLNLLEVFTNTALGNWRRSFFCLTVVLLYGVGIFFSAWLPKRINADLRRWVILVDILSALLMCLSPTDSHASTYFSIFAMSFQWTVFTGKQGYPCSTIFSTNNLRQFLEAWVAIYLDGEEVHRPRMYLYGQTLLSFHAGVIAVCGLWLLGCGRWSLLGMLPASALALVYQRQNQRLRRCETSD